MPTNDERRKLAARLRNIIGYTSLDILETIQEACGCNAGLAWEDVMELKNRLADLIEPEPERTCEVTEHNDCGPHAEDCTIVLSCGHETLGYIPNYCPQCGAKVVS